MSLILGLRMRMSYLFLSGLITGLVTLWLIVFHDLRLSIKSVPKVSAEEHIVFIKTHKTAGSSIQNMLMRYGASRNLMFAVPQTGNYFGHPQKFKAKMAMRLEPGLEYNIFTHHCRYDRHGIASIMPKNTRYFTILRDPVDVFEALYSYFYLNIFASMTLEKFVLFNESDAEHKYRDKRFYYSKFGRNQMSFDLGLNVSSFEKPGEVALFAKQLEKEFDLVMITERLPESLILLKHLLGWSTDDIVIFHHNCRQDKLKKRMTPELKAGILRLHKADKYIYDHFSSILEMKILAFGLERMRAELKDLNETTLRWYDFCVESKAEINNLHGRNKVNNYRLLGIKTKHGDNITCEHLTKKEMHFTYEIRKYMWGFYNTNMNDEFTHLF